MALVVLSLVVPFVWRRCCRSSPVVVATTAASITEVLAARKKMAQTVRRLLRNAIGTYFVSSTVVREVWYGPDRVDAVVGGGDSSSDDDVDEKRFLPSVLSRFEMVKDALVPKCLLSDSDGDGDGEAQVEGGGIRLDPMNVHLLEYTPTNTNSNTTNSLQSNQPTQTSTTLQHRYDAIYCNHGFGASSLSFLPVLPSLTERLRARLSVAHDAPGFGFTDRLSTSASVRGERGKPVLPYTADGNAALGIALLKTRLKSSLVV